LFKPGGGKLRAWRTEVIGRYPHPGRGFTQGLIAEAGPAGQIEVWESTGLYGQSALCRYRLGDVQPRRRAGLDPTLFGEGICRDGAHIWQLTWQDRVALRSDGRTLEPVDEVSYDRDGWGICAAGGYIVTSDGSSELVRRDPGTLSPWGQLQVRLEGVPVPGLNDLAWSGGRIWANVIGTQLLAGIDLDSGEVTDTVDARDAGERLADDQAVMNGIAALPAPGEFLLTGKTYRYLRRVRLVPAEHQPADFSPGAQAGAVRDRPQPEFGGGPHR
jgi:glutaminyl-peptide cyclotransferase